MATENDKVNTGALATLVVVGTASMIGISLAVNALVRHEVGSIGVERDATGELAYQALKREQLARLSAPAALSDAGDGRVSIPIERAMSLVLTDLKRSPWNATPSPPPDAGADANAVDAVDAGADGAATADAAVDSAPDAAAPEPPGAAPLSPSVPSTPPSAKPAPLAPTPHPSTAPAPAPKPPTPAAPTAAVPPAPPAPHAPPAPPTPPATP